MMRLFCRAVSVKRKPDWKQPPSINTKAPPDFSEGALMTQSVRTYACSNDLNLLWRNFQLLSTSFCEASISASHCDGFAILS